MALKGYFDNAATTLVKPEGMYEYVVEYMKDCGANVSRGSYATAKSATKIVRDTRDLLLQLVHAPKTKEVVFTPSATIALNTILSGQNLGEKDIVYISPFEHNAVLRSLHSLQNKYKFKIEYLATSSSSISFDFSIIKNQFLKNRPSLVIISHVSNVVGLVAPIKNIAEEAKKYNAIVVVDAAQACGIIDIEVNQDIDYYVFAGHKTLLAPFGVGGFICNKNTTLPPFVYGGTGVDSANIEMPNTVPERYEAGSQNIMAISGLYYSLSWILNNIEFYRNKERENQQKLKELLSSYDFINLIGVDGESISIVSCTFDSLTSDEAGILLAERGVAVRTGLHCAPVAHKMLGSFPEGLIRFSVSCFTDEKDFEVLQQALDDLAEELL